MRAGSLLLAGLGLIANLLASAPAQAQFAPFELPPGIRLELGPAEAALLADTADGRLDNHDLLSAALVADAVSDPATAKRYRRQFEGWLADLQPVVAGRPEPSDRVRAVFELLCRRVLCGPYRESSSSLAELFDHGRYNCLSSTVVFCCLAQRVGLDVRAAETPGHVIARFANGTRTTDIETTSRDWFHGSRRPPAEISADYRQLSQLGLLALIYYNRGVEALQSRQFDTALLENLKALRLDPDSPTARTNLLAALNNGALAASDEGRHLAALEQLKFGRSIAPEFAPLVTNSQIIRQRQAALCCRHQQYRQALELLADSRREDPQNAALRAAEAGLLNAEGIRLLEAGHFDEAVRWYIQALDRHSADNLLTENLQVAVRHWADEALRRHDYAEAIRRSEYAGRQPQAAADARLPRPEKATRFPSPASGRHLTVARG